MKRYNFAVLGTGGIVERGHAGALLQTPSAQLWSVLSRSKTRAEEIARRFSARAGNPAFDSLSALLKDPELDAVIISTPDKLHMEQAIACAQAGKHILLEKPMATSPEDCKKILAACEVSGVQLSLAYRLRWNAGHRQLVSSAHRGEFGELRHVRALWTFKSADNSNWRASTELGRWWGLAANGTHCLDFVRWVLLPSAGEIVEAKSVISKPEWRGPHDEIAVLALRFESGATAEICNSVLFDSPSRLEIYGSNGYAIAEETTHREGGGRIWTNTGRIDFENTDPFVAQIENFVSAMEGRSEIEVSGREGTRNVEILCGLA